MEPAPHLNLNKFTSALVLISLGISLFFLGLWLSNPADYWREIAALSMKANTALALTTGGLALLLYAQLPKPQPRWGLVLIIALGLLTFGIGALTQIEYRSNLNFNIDQMLGLDFKNAESSLYPGRMSPIASTGMLLLGASILLLFSLRRSFQFLHQALSLLLVMISAFALVGYAMGVALLYKVGPFIRISPYSAVCLIFLAVASLCLRSQFGFMHIITSRTPGGMAVRRLLPAALFLPPIIGYLRLQGQRVGIYDLPQGTSISVIAYILLFSFFIYRSGRSLNRADLEKTQAAKEFLEELEHHSLQLEKAIRARDEFLSIASHELKTPLTSLKLQLQMQMRIFEKRISNGELPEEKAQVFFETADRQVNRLSRLIEDMLDIGRIESGKFRLLLENFNLVELVKEVAGQMSGEMQIAGSQLNLYLPPEVIVRADKVRLAQVLINLLSNSCKYGSRQPIDVSLREDISKGKIYLTVRDGGLGIDAPDQARIFVRFERAVSGTNISGLGLGLYIVRQIMEQHQGKISVESKLGEGAIFTLELPKETILPSATSLGASKV
jgi:signal transduction histidine kinase